MKLRCLTIYLLVGIFWSNPTKAQVGNYIANGSFEEIYDCDTSYDLNEVKHWSGTDSLSGGALFYSTCNSKVPVNGNTFQYPRTGSTYIIGTMYFFNTGRVYAKNRLKQTLQAGKTYCTKFYINIANSSPRGINGFGIYFGDNTIDTITKCNVPLTYLNPQVKNPLVNVISDTLNWVPITGTFVANGTEKFALIGNFLPDNAVVTASINTPSFPQNWTDVLVDDVSCIEVDLPAYAGPDQQIYTGESVFIGREPDFAIDKSCIWYQLPSTIAIDTISGMWVTPLVTSTYVVRQELECGSVKWDTVVVGVDANIVDVGIEKLNRLSENISLAPNPTSNNLNVLFSDADAAALQKFMITNSLGQLIREEDVELKNSSFIISTVNLPPGLYQLHLKTAFGLVTKKFVKIN